MHETRDPILDRPSVFGVRSPAKITSYYLLLHRRIFHRPNCHHWKNFRRRNYYLIPTNLMLMLNEQA